MEIYVSVRPTVLILESSPKSLAQLSSLLHTHYTVRALRPGNSITEVSRDVQPDLILIDTTHPDNEGFEACRCLKADELTRQIPVIFLTCDTSLEFQQTVFDMGAVDFVTRPICPPALLSRIQAQVAVANQARSLSTQQEIVEYGEGKSRREMSTLQEMTLSALSSITETRDTATGRHLKRSQHYMFALGQHLLQHPRFSHYLSLERLDILFKCAPLHDIGKVGIPGIVLPKPGRYDSVEFELMKAPPKLGHDAIQNAQVQAGDRGDFLETAKEIVYSHHEKWDGSGYPQGLVGDEIPIAARLMAIADGYDALISPRLYKDGMTHDQATQIIVGERGRHFDPDVVDAFVALSAVFQGIATRFGVTHAEMPKAEEGLTR